jgi:redox-sensing transcriptional repressor
MPGSSQRPRQLTEPTIARLPIYQRIVNELARRGREQIDSPTLGRLAGVAPATVRRDLSALGPLGTRGSGYATEVLAARIEEALGQDRQYDLIVVGLGNLGRALVNSENFLIAGARLVGLYDSSPEVIGTEIRGLTVGDIDGPLEPASLAVLCVPASAAQAAADRLIESDIHAILNFAQQVISVPIGTAVRYVDVSIELQILAYHLTNGTGPLGGGLIHTLGISRPMRAASG